MHIPIAIALIVVAIIAIYLMKRFNKPQDPYKDIDFPDLDNEEIVIVGLCQHIMDISDDDMLPVYVIRDKHSIIPHLAKTWDEFNGGKGTVGRLSHGVVYINRDTVYTDNYHFGMTVMHELLHAKGYDHGEGMARKERGLHKKLKSQMIDNKVLL